MSVKVTSWVWEHSQAKGSARLVLLALADHAGADGGDAYPSVRRLATRCGVSERTVQEALRTLAELGEIEIRQNAGPHGTNRYRVICSTPAESAPPADIAPPRKAPQGPPQNLHVAPAGSAPEPSLTVQEPPLSSTSDSRVPRSVWRAIAERKLSIRKGDPLTDPSAWIRKTARNAEAEQRTDAEWIWETYDITESQLVSVLLGSRGLLGSLRKRAA